MATIVILLLMATLLMLAISWLLPGFAAGVWSPTPRDVLNTMFQMAQPQKGEHLVDLGYGDGRFLIYAVRGYGLHATGYDLNPLWFLWTRCKAILMGISGHVTLKRDDIFRADLSDADIVVMFLSQAAHNRMALRLKEQLPAGARVVTYQRTFPEWSEADRREVRKGKYVYLFRQKEKASYGE